MSHLPKISYVKLPGKSLCRCFKCSGVVREDYRYRKEHAKKCYGYKEAEARNLDVYTCLESFFYKLTPAPDGLIISIETPAITLDVERDVHKCSMLPSVLGILMRNSKEIRMIHGDLKELMYMADKIDKGYLKPLYKKEEDIEVIRQALPGHVGFHSFSSLLSMHLTKGHYYRELLSLEEARNCFTDHELNEESLKAPLEARLLEVKEDLILKLRFRYNGHVAGVLISEDFFFSTEALKLEEILSPYGYMIEPNQIPHQDWSNLHAFAKRYPSFGLAAFLNNQDAEHGKIHVLFPLLCGSYHKGMELLAKAGCVNGALFDQMRYLSMDTAACTSPKAMYGLPAKILKKVQPEVFTWYRHLTHLPDLNSLYQAHPTLFAYEKIFLNMFRLLSDIQAQRQEHMETGTFYKLPFNDDENNLTKHQVLKMLQYLYEHPRADLGFYKDYICMSVNVCQKVDFFPDNLSDAHDQVMLAYFIKNPNYTMTDEVKFQISVLKYKNLETTPDEEGTEDVKFFIRAPYNIDELIKEGRSMSHCVGSYVENVKNAKSKILFLRRVDAPDISLVTLEVDPNDRLIQAKAKFNKHPKVEVQRFIRNWCNDKGLPVCTFDLSETA